MYIASVAWLAHINNLPRPCVAICLFHKDTRTVANNVISRLHVVAHVTAALLAPCTLPTPHMLQYLHPHSIGPTRILLHCSGAPSPATRAELAYDATGCPPQSQVHLRATEQWVFSSQPVPATKRGHTPGEANWRRSPPWPSRAPRHPWQGPGTEGPPWRRQSHRRR